MSDIWQEVDDFLEQHHDDYKMSFALEYSSIIDWVADFTPRKNHPQAREYGLWQASASTREEAVHRALILAKSAIEKRETGNGTVDSLKT